MEASELKKESVYLTKSGKEIVFKYIGQTGMAIFQPLGEPDFQSCFGLKDLTTVVKFVRKGTKEDLGY